jgi:hypothetical protein
MSEHETVLRDWYIIKVFDQDKRIGQLLWGFVVDDTERFERGGYVCTSSIDVIDNNVITTSKGRKYILEGTGKEFTAYFSEVDLLRRGYSPEQVVRLRNS